MEANERQNVIISTPKTMEERMGVAGSCVRKLNIELPALVDDFQNTTEAAYRGWPDRIYVIGRDGRVAYKSRPGPFGFHPAEAAAVLDLLY